MARVRDAGMEERLLDAAFRIFGERSFAATTMKHIAAELNISSGTIYTYFPDKETLFCAAVTRGWENFIDEMERIYTESRNRQERISALLDRGFSTLAAALPLIKGMFFDANRLNLIESRLDRICLAIDRLLDPEETEGARDWEDSRPRRLLVLRIVILGILATAALVPLESPEATLARLRDAAVGLIETTGLMERGPKAEA
jgi:AcrR family transcriptional regulator